jgi:hypothetical protein
VRTPVCSAGSPTILATWQSSQNFPPTTSAGATKPLQTVVAVPCPMVLKGSRLPAGRAKPNLAARRCARRSAGRSDISHSGTKCRPSSVGITPGRTAVARTPWSRCRRSNSTVNSRLLQEHALQLLEYGCPSQAEIAMRERQRAIDPSSRAPTDTECGACPLRASRHPMRHPRHPTC